MAFSTRSIRALASKHNPWPLDRLAPLVDLAGPGATLAEAFDTAYRVMAREYRCEYVYANAVIHAHGADPETANAITGLRVLVSIADLVIADQHAAAYEIKTDLDSFGRLALQLHSYSTCFEYVHVVTSAAKAERAVRETPGHVGVLALDGDGCLTVVRSPSGGLARIDRSAAFRVLRRDELVAILHRQMGYTVDVPNARLYRRLNELFMTLPVEIAYQEFVTALRERDLAKRRAARSAGLPGSLCAAAAGLALTPTAWGRLGEVLQRPAREFVPR
ncbi:sce7726 family protein [Mycobacterium adipatum]|uniref:sce7726 family protein n=1 Tax=Mycobacterium adipatum TaxID=1682113 RepID=UPI0034E070B4